MYFYLFEMSMSRCTFELKCQPLPTITCTASNRGNLNEIIDHFLGSPNGSDHLFYVFPARTRAC